MSFQKDHACSSSRVLGLIFCAYPAFGGGPTPVASDLITINAVAYDRHGDPVTDLRPEEVLLSDTGKPQQIVSLRLDQTHKHQPIVILFELLNSRMTGRALVKNEIVQSLRRVESNDNLYLYIFTKRATLSPYAGWKTMRARLSLRMFHGFRLSIPCSTAPLGG
jgi:hypothetical protein